MLLDTRYGIHNALKNPYYWQLMSVKRDGAGVKEFYAVPKLSARHSTDLAIPLGFVRFDPNTGQYSLSSPSQGVLKLNLEG